MPEIALELLGLEDPILSQRSGPNADGHRVSRPSSSVAPSISPIYIDRRVVKRRTRPVRQRRPLSGGRKRVLIVLFIPSVERDGTTLIDQQHWVDAALEMFGRVFGGATAYPKAKGIWRDDERNGALVKDEPVVVQCYTTPADIEDSKNLAELGSFCRTMGDATRGRERLAWWLATSTSPSGISQRSRR